jgi:hypothetical protein
MDPLAFIVTAIVAGAAVAAKDTAAQAVKDAYEGLKTLIKRKFGGEPNAGDLDAAMRQVEKKPEDQSRQNVLKDELQAAKVDQDADVIKLAQALVEVVRQREPAAMQNVHVSVTGSGAAAVGPGAQAVGAGGVLVGGSNTGGINTGTQTTHNYFGPPAADPAGAAGTGVAASPEGRKLYQLLNDFFNMGEIEGLCFEMGIDEENLRGETKAGKAKALVLHIEAAGRLDELKKLMRVQRPNLRSQLQ